MSAFASATVDGNASPALDSHAAAYTRQTCVRSSERFSGPSGASDSRTLSWDSRHFCVNLYSARYRPTECSGPIPSRTSLSGSMTSSSSATTPGHMDSITPASCACAITAVARRSTSVSEDFVKRASYAASSRASPAPSRNDTFSDPTRSSLSA